MFCPIFSVASLYTFNELTYQLGLHTKKGQRDFLFCFFCPTFPLTHEQTAFTIAKCPPPREINLTHD